MVPFELEKGEKLIQRLSRDYLNFFHQPLKQIDLQSWVGMLIRLGGVHKLRLQDEGVGGPKI